MRKARIVVIGLKGLPAFGGAAAVGESLINQLKEEYDFTVLSTASHTDGNVKLDKIEQIVFKNTGKGGINTFYYYMRCLIHVLFHSYDLVHLHHAESGFITPFLRLKYKVIVTFHGVFLKTDPKFSKLQNSFFRFSERLNVRFANRTISVSKPDTFYVKEKYNKEIGYIPNGIEILSLDKNNSTSDISFAAGRIYQIKGLHLVLEAIKKINFADKIRVAGDLDQVDEYKLEIMKMSEGLDIEFKGLIKKKKELLEYISSSKLFIFPSLTEAMSMMLLEVVSTKTPILASDIPATKAIFNDDEILFFKNDNIEDLTEKIKFAFENSEAMNKKAEKAYDKIKGSYTWERISNLYENEYKKLLKK